MDNLEKLIRDAISNGSETSEIARTLTGILNKIEAEKADEEAKKREEKDRLEEIKEKFLSNLMDEFDNHWDVLECSARDAAIVALFAASEKKENSDWTIEDMEFFLKNMTKNIESNMKMMEGHKSPEERLKQAEKVLNDQIEEEFKGLFRPKITTGDLVDRSKSAVDEMAQTADELIKAFLKKKGW